MPASTSPNAKRPAEAPVINEEADRILGRIILRYGGVTFAQLFLMTFAMAPINMKGSPVFKWHQAIDVLSILLVFIPFLLGISKLFAARLRIGRDLVERGVWRQAIAALDPFEGFTQRFLDGSGEAHYLLSKAYAGAGEKAKAERARQFVLKHRAGVWADKLRDPAPIAIGALKTALRQEKSAEKTVTGVKGKRKRRF
ncbi:hypothetical protein CCAX7_005030 [Capsulimonas corticalis]|uniref:Uncharacterized protein n=1 Tax=Capsulimonas corticalis TaxID=2219043 RepID=A0A402D2N3_9BACT|nr:hypothetical protein [Capsulimonas corticalis]BDI28452.1 hypothetical protein CCAX7_005030 [Capsulimonas corticalis]